MTKICFVTGRRPVKGNIINRKGQSKKSGGIGTHVTSITKRKFRPNLQKVRIRTANGGTKRVWFRRSKDLLRASTIPIRGNGLHQFSDPQRGNPSACAPGH
jgi:large subunit ribosomal protein L28